MGEPFDDLERDGYVVLRDLLDDKEVRRIRTAVDPLLATTPTGRIDFEGFHTQRVYNLLGKCPDVAPLYEHPDVMALCEKAFAGPHFQLSIGLIIHILPGEKAQVLHHDDGLFPVGWPHQTLVLNTMWAITPFTEANGATRIVPGSHTTAGAPPKGADVIAAEMDPGSVLVWLGTLWHGGGANSTEEARLGVAINYTPGWLRQQENQYLALRPEVVAGFSERLQRLVGWSYHPPFIGFVDGRDPNKLLKG